VWFIWVVSRGRRGKHEGARSGSSTKAKEEKWEGAARHDGER
jgi:hypothetical protein